MEPVGIWNGSNTYVRMILAATNAKRIESPHSLNFDFLPILFERKLNTIATACQMIAVCANVYVFRIGPVGFRNGCQLRVVGNFPEDQVREENSLGSVTKAKITEPTNITYIGRHPHNDVNSRKDHQ